MQDERNTYERREMQEHYTQKAIFDFARLYERHYPALQWMHSVPNGGKRTEREGIWMRDEGLTKGVSDIFIPFPTFGYHGFYVEVKSTTGRLMKEQQEFLECMAARGYLTDVWRSFDQAQLTLMRYIQGDIQRKKMGCCLWR